MSITLVPKGGMPRFPSEMDKFIIELRQELREQEGNCTLGKIIILV